MNDYSHLIQRKRVGEISFLHENGTFGFISAEDFREDVFFHMSAWQSANTCPKPELTMIVEFEIDQAHRKESNKLRASVVRPTDRPYTSVLPADRDPHLKAKHHPKARRRKPTWRRKDS